MRIKCLSKNSTVNLSATGLMAALVLVATMFFKIQIPVGGDKTMLGFANVFCILSGLLLGPVYGGLAAGIGSALFDLLGGWASSAPVTLVTKFMMAFLCGVIVWGAKNGGKKLSRIIVGAVTGSLSYCVLYIAYSWAKLALIGSAWQAIQLQLAVKIPVTLLNALAADVIAVPLFCTVRKALTKALPSLQ
jgi:uncharacterized membrane protein